MNKYRRFLKNPKVLDGAVISVGLEAEAEPLDHTQYAKELTSIIANFAQVISIVILSRN